jgi:hypothetical protein
MWGLRSERARVNEHHTDPFTFLRVTIFNQENEKLGLRYPDWVLKWDIYEFISNPNKSGSFYYGMS